MKNIALLFVLILAFAACSKKTVPAKNVGLTKDAATKPPVNNNTAANTVAGNTPDSAKSDTTASVVPAAPTAMIVIDGYGKILTPQKKLPAGTNLKPDYSTIARAFTPQQLANLKARYKTVPPKILYVPDQYALKSLKGTYCIYKKKFWYWKKEDGLFYIDQMYYQ